MKKILLGLLLFFQIATSSGQYNSILGNFQNSWNISNYTIFGYLTDSLNVTGDSLINGINYKIVESNMIDLNGSSLFGNSFYGLFREDTVTGKAWFKRELMPSENLFYDISLNIADSFFVPGFGGGYYLVDSVYFENNRKIVRVDFNYASSGFNYFNQKLTFIEGVLTNYGFDYQQSDPMRSDPVLLCAIKDNQYIFQQNYQDPFYTGCNTFFALGLDENTDLAKLCTISPNPNHGKFNMHINLTTSTSGVIKIFDLKGVEIQSLLLQPRTTSQEIILPDAVSTGIYNCVIITEDFTVNKKIAVFKNF